MNWLTPFSICQCCQRKRYRGHFCLISTDTHTHTHTHTREQNTHHTHLPASKHWNHHYNINARCYIKLYPHRMSWDCEEIWMEKHWLFLWTSWTSLRWFAGLAWWFYSGFGHLSAKVWPSKPANHLKRFISAEKAELKRLIDGKEAFITEQLNNTSTSVTLPSWQLNQHN